MIFNSQCFRILRFFALLPGKPGATVLGLVTRFNIPAPHQRITELRHSTEKWQIAHYVDSDGIDRYYMTRTEARRAMKYVNAITSAHLAKRMREAA